MKISQTKLMNKSDLATKRKNCTAEKTTPKKEISNFNNSRKLKETQGKKRNKEQRTKQTCVCVYVICNSTF